MAQLMALTPYIVAFLACCIAAWLHSIVKA